jgi:hypothetical protein
MNIDEIYVETVKVSPTFPGMDEAIAHFMFLVKKNNFTMDDVQKWGGADRCVCIDYDVDTEGKQVGPAWIWWIVGMNGEQYG